MGQRSRRRERAGNEPPASAPAATPSPRRARAAQRDARIRASLEPLAPGERPGAVTVAALVAAALGLFNIVMFAAGAKIDGKAPSASGVLAFSALMFTAAGGMWRARYWAVLGFEALLALIVLVFAGLLVVAANVLAVVVSLAVVTLAGWLFWKLIRAMARIQMPERPGR